MRNARDRSKQNSPTNWVGLIYYLISTKQGLKVIGILIIVIIIIFSLFIYIMRPAQLDVQTNAGTISIKNGSIQNTVFMLSASGSRENNRTPWTRTGIMVKKGDKIKMQASGRVHTALKKLIDVAETDKRILPSWVGPGGSTVNQEKEWDIRREENKLMPDGGDHYGYGMLLAAIRDESKGGEVGSPVAVGDEHEWEAEKDGELVLAVNDLLLDGKSRDVYALPLKNNYQYYKTIVQREDRLRKENNEYLSNKTLNEKINESYQRRLSTWDNEIVPNGNWLIWYDDNVGAFSVSITVNQHA